MARKKYTHIFFDLDNTLWDFKTNSKFAIHSAFQILKLDEKGIDFENFFRAYSGYNNALWTAYRNKEIKKKELTSQRFKLTLDELDINDVEPAEMNRIYLSEMPKQNKLVDGALDLLNYLKDKKYQLAVITNGFSEVQHNKLYNSGLTPFFGKIFISEELKAPKPARKIFEHAIKSTNAKKSTSLMVGDDLEVDILGAAQAGIDAVYLNRSKRTGSQLLKDNKLNDKFLEISSLAELKTIL